MKKCLLVAGLALALGVAIHPTATVTAESASETPASSAEATSKTYSDEEKANWGKRRTPVPFGEAVEWTFQDLVGRKFEEITAKVSLVEVLRGQAAVDKVMTYSSHNDEALLLMDSDKELVLLKLKLEYIAGNETTPYKTGFRVIVFDETGKEVKGGDFDIVLEIDKWKQFNGVEIQPGKTHEGYIPVAVPKNQSYSIALRKGNHLFFATE